MVQIVRFTDAEMEFRLRLSHCFGWGRYMRIKYLQNLGADNPSTDHVLQNWLLLKYSGKSTTKI